MKENKGKNLQLKGKLELVKEGFRAAERMENDQTKELERLRKLNLDKRSEAERRKDRVYKTGRKQL